MTSPIRKKPSKVVASTYIIKGEDSSGRAVCYKGFDRSSYVQTTSNVLESYKSDNLEKITEMANELNRNFGKEIKDCRIKELIISIRNV